MKEIEIKKMDTNFEKTNMDIGERIIMINKFINKFPKVKLNTIIKINKHFNNKNIENDDNVDNNLLYNYVVMHN